MGGVGRFIGSIFGGGGNISSPQVITREVEAAPREAEHEAESVAVRDEEQRKLRRRRLMSGTLLTSPLGTSGGSATGTGGSAVLGRMGS